MLRSSEEFEIWKVFSRNIYSSSTLTKLDKDNDKSEEINRDDLY